MNSKSSAPNRPKRIIIIGAVAAGTSAAAKARRNDETADIIIYERDKYISYSGCGLPYYIGGKVDDIKKLTPRNADFFKNKYNVDVKTRHEVVKIDYEKRKIQINNLEADSVFEDEFDILVIATGAIAVKLPVPGAELPHVFTLRSPSDAVSIKSRIDNNKPAQAVVIGSGFIGLEMVENLTACGIKVSLVEKLPQLCPFVDPDMAPYLEEYLKNKNIDIYTDSSVIKINEKTVVLSDNTEIEADIVIMAAGIKPNVGLAVEMGVNLGSTGAIAVDACMRTNLPDVYACGDCAEAFSVIDGRALYRPLGSTANKMGRIAGDMITGGCLAFRGVAGTGIFKIYEMAIAACGLSEKEARDSDYDVIVSHNIKPDKPTYFGGREMVIKTIADRSTEKLLGVQIIGYEGVDKRIDVFVTAITAGLKVSDLFHLDLAYAPPFSTTKDPVMYTGMILDNAISQGRALITSDELSCCDKDSVQVIDAREEGQYSESHVDNAVSMPHVSLRQKIASLDKNKPVITYCNKGTTGNAAQNILINNGFSKVYNLSGGHKQFKITKKNRRK